MYKIGGIYKLLIAVTSLMGVPLNYLKQICEEVKQTEEPTLYDQPITIEETGKSDEGSEHISEEVKENDVAASATTPLISDEAEESADVKEDTKEEAHQDQVRYKDFYFSFSSTLTHDCGNKMNYVLACARLICFLPFYW